MQLFKMFWPNWDENDIKNRTCTYNHIGRIWEMPLPVLSPLWNSKQDDGAKLVIWTQQSISVQERIIFVKTHIFWILLWCRPSGLMLRPSKPNNLYQRNIKKICVFVKIIRSCTNCSHWTRLAFSAVSGLL